MVWPHYRYTLYSPYIYYKDHETPHLQQPQNWDKNLLQPLDRSCFPHVMVASAYKDPRVPNQIRVMLVGDVRIQRRIYCHLVLDSTHIVSVNASAPNGAIFEGNAVEMNYDGFFVNCPSRIFAFYHKITHLSLSCTPTVIGENIVPVYSIPEKPPQNGTIGACVGPLHFNRTVPVKIRSIVTWIEMNRLLGVGHFIFYNYSFPSDLRPVLEFYRSIGVASLIQWYTGRDIPTKTFGRWPPPKDELPYFGQFALNNECLLRYTNQVQYVMFTDIDEILFPLIHPKLTNLVVDLEINTTAAYSFSLTYMRSDFKMESTTDFHPLASKFHISFVERTMRETRVFPESVAAKLLVKSNIVRKVGVHDVIEMRHGFKVNYLKPNVSLLLHYRDPPPYLYNASISGVKVMNLPSYLGQLLTNTEEILKQLNLMREVLDRK